MTVCDCGFEIGDAVSFPGGKGEITKIDHRDSSPCLLYIHTDDGLQKRPSALRIDKLSSSVDRLKSGDFDDPELFDLRTKATRLDLAHREDRFVTLESNRIDIEPYQVKAAHEILSSYDHRYLIGDEVGLGKTIEAGIVIEELLARGRAERVLIVTPAPLTHQWQEELREKFGQDYIVYERDYVEAQRGASPTENIWAENNRIITSIDFAKQDDMLDALKNLEEEWDIAVFDEAHHLTARRRNDTRVEKTERYKAGEAVASNSDGLLFLTGTPHNGKADQFYFMMSLLDPFRFRDEHDISPEKLDDMMIRRLKDDMYEEDGTRMFLEKNIETLPVQFTDAEKQLYEDVTEYLTEYYNLATQQEKDAAGFAMVVYQKRLVSSIHAIRKSLKSRMEHIRAGGVDPDEFSPLVRELLPQYRENPDLLKNAQRERVEEELEGLTVSSDPDRVQEEYEIVRDLYNTAKQIDVDSKASGLREFIDGVLAEDPDEKILVFTEYTDTLEYLQERIFPDRDLAIVHGGLNQKQRREQLEHFENRANVMLATDAAREGINLQFAHIMVNYDLPWNPTRIDQRVGRLHRYGQDKTVEIRNLFVEDTRESKILQLLMEKIEEIEKQLGMTSDILGMVLNDVDLEDQIMSTVARDDDPQQIANQIDETINAREQELERIENEFLTREQFNLSEEDHEILDIIEESREEIVGREDVEYLVRSFCRKFGGEIMNVRAGAASDSGEVFDLEVPDVLAGGSVAARYEQATFDRDSAQADREIEFLSLDHPLVQSILEFCLEPDRGGGLTAIKTAGGELGSPGLLCRFRLGYLSGTGETVQEQLAEVYVTVDGEVIQNPDGITGGLPDSEADSNQVSRVVSSADQLYDSAETEAWEIIQDLAAEAQEKQQRAVSIKRQHAERYFESRIKAVQERLDTSHLENPDSDRRAAIGKAERRLNELRQERDAELARLEEEEQVIPEEPELVNMAVVINSFED